MAYGAYKFLFRLQIGMWHNFRYKTGPQTGTSLSLRPLYRSWRRSLGHSRGLREDQLWSTAGMGGATSIKVKLYVIVTLLVVVGYSAQFSMC